MGSLLGGLALANAGLGAVHGLAAPLGGLAPVPHGAACAALLPHVLEANLRASGPGSPVRVKFRELAGLLTGDPGADTQDGLRWVQETVVELRVPSLGHYGLSAADLDTIAERGLAASSMKANPVTFNRSALVGILTKAM